MREEHLWFPWGTGERQRPPAQGHRDAKTARRFGTARPLAAHRTPNPQIPKSKAGMLHGRARWGHTGWPVSLWGPATLTLGAPHVAAGRVGAGAAGGTSARRRARLSVPSEE